MRPHDAHARREPLTTHGDREQRDRVSDRVRERHEDDAPRHLTRGCERSDCCQNGPGAWHHDETGADADDESTRLVGDRPARQEQERPLEDAPDTLREEARGEDHEHDDRQRAQKILGEVECAQEGSAGERERRERDDEAGHYGVGAPPAVTRGGSREEQREHRKHTRAVTTPARNAIPRRTSTRTG